MSRFRSNGAGGICRCTVRLPACIPSGERITCFPESPGGKSCFPKASPFSKAFSGRNKEPDRKRPKKKKANAPGERCVCFLGGDKGSVMIKDGWFITERRPLTDGFSRRRKCCNGCWRCGGSWRTIFCCFPTRSKGGGGDGDGGGEVCDSFSSYVS